MVLGKQGPIAKMVTGAIGITQEYRADQKARKEKTDETKSSAQATEYPPPTGHPSHSDSETEDDEAWAQDLDEAQAAYALQHEDEVSASESDPPPYTPSQASSEPLEAPVILPQRRPGVRTRGFVRGYAPILQPRGISADGWLKFLNGFDQAIGKNRLFFVLNIAVFVADHVQLALGGISVTVHFAALAAQLSIEMSRRAFMHSKQNTYLDKMNESYFKPRGLYAMIIKYKPKKSSNDQDTAPCELVDLQANITETVASREDMEGKFWKGLIKAAASTSHSEQEVPEFAPLTFPYLDELDEASKKSVTKQKGAFLADHYDRQAQSTFAADNPDSKLANVAPRKEWSSEYADPTNPKGQGNLISTLSGGHIQPGSRIRKTRARLGIGGPTGESIGERRTKKKSSRPIKKLLRQDALYLMVVDLPTEGEMEAVRKAFEELADQ